MSPHGDEPVSSRRRAIGVVPASMLAGLGILGCGGSGEEAVVTRDGGMEIRDAWVRPTPPTAEEAAIYVEIENVDAPADRLLGGRSNRCLTVHPHLTTVDDEGVARMTTTDAEQLALDPGTTLRLEPNGLHLMCVGLDRPLEEGDEVQLELVFERHTTIAVPVTVRAAP